MGRIKGMRSALASKSASCDNAASRPPPLPPPPPSSAACRHLRLQDVEGVGPAGKLAKVNHGYARNFLVPNQLALVVPRPRRGHRAAAAAEARSSSGAGAVARQQQAASSSAPLQLSLEKQQQQFDKLIKTLTGAPLVRGQAGWLRLGRPACAAHCRLPCCAGTVRW